MNQWRVDSLVVHTVLVCWWWLETSKMWRINFGVVQLKYRKKGVSKGLDFHQLYTAPLILWSVIACGISYIASSVLPVLSSSTLRYVFWIAVFAKRFFCERSKQICGQRLCSSKFPRFLSSRRPTFLESHKQDHLWASTAILSTHTPVTGEKVSSWKKQDCGTPVITLSVLRRVYFTCWSHETMARRIALYLN